MRLQGHVLDKALQGNQFCVDDEDCGADGVCIDNNCICLRVAGPEIALGWCPDRGVGNLTRYVDDFLAAAVLVARACPGD